MLFSPSQQQPSILPSGLARRYRKRSAENRDTTSRTRTNWRESTGTEMSGRARRQEVRSPLSPFQYTQHKRGLRLSIQQSAYEIVDVFLARRVDASPRVVAENDIRSAGKRKGDEAPLE